MLTYSHLHIKNLSSERMAAVSLNLLPLLIISTTLFHFLTPHSVANTKCMYCTELRSLCIQNLRSVRTACVYSYLSWASKTVIGRVSLLFLWRLFLFLVLIYIREAHECIFTALLLVSQTIRGLCDAVSSVRLEVVNSFSILLGISTEDQVLQNCLIFVCRYKTNFLISLILEWYTKEPVKGMYTATIS